MLGMFKWATALAVGIMSLSSVALGDWCYETKTARGGVNIQQDYQVYEGFSRFAGPFIARAQSYIHVRDVSFKGNENVRIVFITKDADGNEISVERFDRIDYNPNDGGYTIGLPDIQVITAEITGDRFHEVAVSINGQWLKIQNSWRSNFVFDARRIKDYCY